METTDKRLTPEMFEPADVGSREQERIPGPPVGFWKDSWGRLKKNRGALVAGAIILLLLVMAFVGPTLTRFGPYEQDLTRQFVDPFSTGHWFGTDSFGRDVWARVWEGAQITLFIAVFAALLDLVVGVAWGAVSAYFGGRTDDIMQRVVEILVGIPNLVIVILAMLALGTGAISLIIALALTGWVTMSRIVRGKVLQLKEQEFFLASRSLGAGGRRLMVKHLLPNSLGIIIVNLMLTIPTAIFFEAFLSFIGLGIQPPDASLGSLISEGYSQLRFNPFLLWIPSAVFCALMICFNMLGDGLRDAFDPKMRR